MKETDYDKKQYRKRIVANKANSKKYFQENKDKIYEYKRKWRAENKDKVKAQVEYWRSNNPAKVSQWGNTRAKKLKDATPHWLTEENWEEMNRFYWLAKDLQVVSGEKYHVDHIIPLSGKTVCGLNVPWNLQILPADLNLAKSCKENFDVSAGR